MYDKNKYKAIEKGFIGDIAREWNNILFDETTNLSNFQEVLESKGIFTKIDKESKQIYFTNDKKNFEKRHSKKVLSLYKIASTFDYQFKNAEEINIFDFDKSLQLLSKGKAKESELEKENILSIGDKEKKEPQKELEKELKKEFLAEETDKLKKSIEEYNSNVNSTIDSFLQTLGDTETTLNVGFSVSLELKDFNILKKEVNTRIANKKLSIAKGSAEAIFKNTLNKWRKEDISKDKVIEKLLGTRDIVARKIKDTLENMPKVDNIKSIEELQKAIKIVENTKKENLEKLNRIGKNHFLTDIKEKINNFIEKVIDFNHNYMDKHIPTEKERFTELEKTLVTEYRATTKEEERGKAINNLYDLEDYRKEKAEEERERQRQRTIAEDIPREKKKKTTSTITVAVADVDVEPEIENIENIDIEDIEKTKELEEKLRQYVENKKKENTKITYIVEDKEKEKEQEMEI